MSRRTEFLSQVASAKTMEVKTEQTGNSSIDRTLDNFNSDYGPALEAVEPVASNSLQGETVTATAEVKIKPNIEINLKPREREKVHKNFQFPKSLCIKIKTLAEQKGVSENALITEILTNVFED